MTPAVQIKIRLVVGNHLLCKALGRILEKRADLFVIEQCTDVSNPARIIEHSIGDVTVLDCAAATLLLRSIGARIREINSSAQILIIGMEPDERVFLRAVRAGVRGYLLNEASAAEVVAAIRSVARGEAVCPSQLRKVLFDTVARAKHFVPRAPSRRRQLTRRQQELFPMIARGLTNKEIASQLNLSEQTVKNHVHRVLRKVGASDRLEIAEIVGTEAFAG